MPALRPCLDCGRPTEGRRCPDHQAAREAARPPRPTTIARPAERAARAATVADHRARHGDWCPGWGTPAHQVTPPNLLTADHVIPAAAGGGGVGAVYQVLCRICNGRKGSETDIPPLRKSEGPHPGHPRPT